MTNEQQLRLEILELRLAMAALERVAARQQETIDMLRERAASESIKRGKDLDAMTEMILQCWELEHQCPTCLTLSAASAVDGKRSSPSGREDTHTQR